MKTIGLTGGIGSGKTTIALMFAQLGVPIYFADEEAKILMNTLPIIKAKLVDEFGPLTFENNELNKPFLAGIIFNNKKKLAKINSIVHPEVKKHFGLWLEGQKSPYVIQENALIFENNNESNYDRIITVTAPMDLKLKRIVDRDKSSLKKARSIMDNQLNDDYRIKKSNYVVQNINIDKSKLKVSLIHSELLDDFG